MFLSQEQKVALLEQKVKRAEEYARRLAEQVKQRR